MKTSAFLFIISNNQAAALVHFGWCPWSIPEPVEDFQIYRYLDNWYEIYRDKGLWYEQDAECVTASYDYRSWLWPF